MSDKLKKLVCNFFEILDSEEESDSGKIFHPVYISSCRVLLTKKMNELITEIKKEIE